MIVMRVLPESRMLMPCHVDTVDMYSFAHTQELGRCELLNKYLYILDYEDIEESSIDEYLEEML